MHICLVDDYKTKDYEMTSRVRFYNTNVTVPFLIPRWHKNSVLVCHSNATWKYDEWVKLIENY